MSYAPGLLRLHEDLELEYYTMPQNMLEALVIWMTSRDTTVDIFGIDERWVTQLDRAGWALPLNDRFPELEERLEPAGLDTFPYQGDRLGVPFRGSLTGPSYHTDILEQYGLSRGSAKLRLECTSRSRSGSLPSRRSGRSWVTGPQMS